MIMFRKVFFSCTFFLLLVLSAHAQLPDTSATNFTLQQCIQLALKNNPIVQHSQVASETQRAYLTGARGNMLPTLNGDITHGLSQGRGIDPFTNTYANQNVN